MQSHDHAQSQLSSSSSLKAEPSDHFQLIKIWLRLCNEGNCSPPPYDTKCVPGSGLSKSPTRLIDLGDRFSLGRLRPGNFSHKTVRLIAPTQPLRYIALSHCWGNLGQRPWLTTSGNLDRRLKTGFSIDDLPSTFQDAITVTRELDERYLWIDSLCILQGEDDDDAHMNDWKIEAGKMQDVFRGAYCTIAATSSENSQQGFLTRANSKSAPPIADNFEDDVLRGNLNTRAWVLQERALSRRILHFTNRQTYWECGGGVRCETLTYLRK